ncbi:MAG: TonB-dependent receptor [Candidatus Cryptobacteroides sp.]|nr:TonB-dependent receptor [Bacteroidales bacterium]MDY2857374.1 TonB-dependent receptor [Candidatus Cryptobacteroides sp.]MDY4631018.1 TonB-dependent receptor [Candidatus Cryptobacteroides sp.]
MKQSIKFLLSAFAAMFVGVTAFAQLTTSSLNGLVADASGEPVIGAAVIATHTESGTSYATVTNNEGRYYINGMRAGGPYKVEVSCLGYRTVAFTDVTLQLAESLSLNAKLEDDAQMLSEAIVISNATSKFAAEKTGAATNISNRQIADLPTVSRSITDVTRLSPYGGNGMSFAGADGRTANFTVDGANFNNNFGLNDGLPGGGSPISIDAIEEMQVVISPYDVRQTNFIGGGVNAITKSGTNTFKGSAYIYHRNENMRGDTVEGETVAGARDKDRNTTYGFTLGGPIVKNKLFFFANFEYSKIPTVANRWRGSTDGVGNADANISRTTLEDLEKVSKHLKDKYGYETGSWTDFPANESNMKVLARLDWNINDKNHLALRYNYTLNKAWSSPNSSSMDGGTRSAYGRTSLYGMSYANSMYSIDNVVHSLSLDLNSRISDNLSNQFLATLSLLNDVRGTDSSDFPFIDIRNDDGSAPMPYISAGYELFTWNNAVHNTHIGIKDDITWYGGKHKVTAGINYEYQMADNSYMRNGTGYYRYLSLDDFLNERAPEVVCLTYGYDGEENPAARVQFHKLGLYAQDEWQANENFKLTYGVRFDGLFFDNKDLMTNNAILALNYGVAHDAQNPDEHVDGCRHIDTGKWPNSNISVSPRVGFVWDVLGDKSLKFRGGTGLFSGRLPLVFFTNMPSNSGMVQYQAILGPKGDQVDMSQFAGKILNRKELYNKLVELGYPTTIKPEDGTLPSAISAVDPKFKMPQVWKTSLAIDYAFPTSFPFSVSAEAIYNKTVNGVCLTDWNVKPVDGFTRFNGVDNRPIYQKGNYLYTSKSAYVLENTHRGYGWSATASINMEPVKGLYLSAAYTHTASKEITGMPGSNASSVLNYMGTVNGPNDPGLHNSQYVTPDRFFANLSYSDKCGNHFGIIYETWRGGYNYSYMTQNDINGDGYNYDLIFIPTDEQVANGDFRFVSQDDADRFLDYVHNDKYLSKHQGEYAEAYSVYSPWVHRIDFSYKHDFKVRIGKSVNTLQLSFDLKNALNLFNSNWGVSKYMNPDLGEGRILKYEGVDKEGYATFSTAKAYNGTTETWQRLHSIGQCWYASVGIRYMFN